MILSDDVKCEFCGKLFCCVQCRKKHENNNHQNEKKISELQSSQAIQKKVSCPICENKPFYLQPNIQQELFNHIVEEHLPLFCRKCSKMYETQENLLSFTKCIKTNNICNLESNKNIKSEKNAAQLPQVEKTSCATQTSPFLAQNAQSNGIGDNAALTPVSMLNNNLQWKIKSKRSSDGYISDSSNSSSVQRSISSFEGSSSSKQVESEVKEVGKLVRSTSTPMQAALLSSNPKESVFDSSGCHVSSIYASSEPQGSNVSPTATGAIELHNCTPGSLSCSKETFLKITNQNKMKQRNKIQISMASPLRQVMSKSIQRAIAKHNSDKHQESSWMKTESKQIIDIMENVSLGSPLDLRTTPALRRSQSEVVQRSTTDEFGGLSRISQRKEQILYSSQKTMMTTTESILVSSSKINSSKEVYRTCRSVEVFTTEYNKLNIDDKSHSNNSCRACISTSSYYTPKITGVPLKKTISFESPPDVLQETCDAIDDEVFYTPTGVPSKGLIHMIEKEEKNIPKNKENQENIDFKSKDFECYNNGNNNNNNKESYGGSLWSLVTSVIRLPSFGSNSNNNNKEKQLQNKNHTSSSSSLAVTSTTLIKRCASFAGTLTTFSNNVDESLKRKRTLTSDGSSLANINENLIEAPPKRIRKIHGRKPIDRMRNSP